MGLHVAQDDAHALQLSVFPDLLQSGQITLLHAAGPHDVQRNVGQPGDDARIRQGGVGNAVHKDEIILLLYFLHQLPDAVMQQKPGGMVRHGSRKQVIQVVGNGGLFHQGTPAALPGLLQIPQARLSGSAQQGAERPLS